MYSYRAHIRERGTQNFLVQYLKAQKDLPIYLILYPDKVCKSCHLPSMLLRIHFMQKLWHRNQCECKKKQQRGGCFQNTQTNVYFSSEEIISPRFCCNTSKQGWPFLGCKQSSTVVVGEEENSFAEITYSSGNMTFLSKLFHCYCVVSSTKREAAFHWREKKAKSLQFAHTPLFLQRNLSSL